MVFLAAFRSFLGSRGNYKTLVIRRDVNGGFSLSMSSNDEVTGRERVGGVVIDEARGDSQQHEMYDAVLYLVDAIKKSKKDYPNHPSFITDECELESEF